MELAPGRVWNLPSNLWSGSMHFRKGVTNVDDRDRRGFSLVEVAVSLVILTVGVLGLAGSTVWVVRQSTIADLGAERAAVVQTVLEQLQASDYATLTPGRDSVGRFDVHWSVETGSRSKLVTVVTVGPGLPAGAGISAVDGIAADTFAYRILRP